MGINLEITIQLGTSGYRIFIVSVQYRGRDNQVLLIQLKYIFNIYVLMNAYKIFFSKVEDPVGICQLHTS